MEDARQMKFATLLIFLFTFLTGSAQAQEKFDYTAFGAWPVLHEGRVKTMESFAHSVFYNISGITNLDDMSALEWLTHSLFDPSSTIADSYIKVDKKSILDLPKDKKYHSMTSVMTALNHYQDLIISLEQKDPAEYSASQRDLMHTYRAVSLYNQIIQSFSAVLPLKGEENRSYIDGGGDNVQRALIEEGGKGNGLLKFIDNDNPSSPKITLWEAVNSDIETPVINDLAVMAKAWNDGDYEIWNKKAAEVQQILQSEIDHPVSLQMEKFYVSLQPIMWAMGLYILGGIIYYVSHKAAIISICAGLFVHLAALITRSIILWRPPTGTLYETLLFGAAIIALVGIIVYIVNRKQLLFTIICAVSASFLLFISRGFIQGDSLSVLVAVLNTNFWLSTHVTCVIIGYGFCIMTAAVAHYLLLINNDGLKKLLLPLTLASLLFMAVGTLLGGIWADQSWGRFWGWDPKENGALLIVLWLTWVLHGRICGQFKERVFMAALALTNIMVALTWFGVNLLGIGLHSYGFISGIAWGLGIFVFIQLLVVGGLYFSPQIRARHG